jgi:hypothetical protein
MCGADIYISNEQVDLLKAYTSGHGAVNLTLTPIKTMSTWLTLPPFYSFEWGIKSIRSRSVGALGMRLSHVCLHRFAVPGLCVYLYIFDPRKD